MLEKMQGGCCSSDPEGLEFGERDRWGEISVLQGGAV